MVHWLLMNGVNPDVVCKPNKQTALHIACSKGHVYCVKSLLRANADVLAIDDQGQTCLSRAEKGKKKDMILPLLRSKQLCLLVAKEDIKGVKDLMSLKGPEQDSFQRHDIEEAIMLAVMKKSLEILEYVIIAGTKYLRKSIPAFPMLETALELAFQLEFIEGIGLLLLCKAVYENTPKLVTRLLSEPTSSQKWYIQPVREALDSGRMRTVLPIHLSVMLERAEVTKELLLLTELDMKKRHVDWSNLRLHTLHSTWIQAITPWVLHLKVTRNRLLKVPVEILQASQLLRLNLGENQLRYIPPGLFALPNLQDLNLRSNLITDLQNVPEWSPSLISLNLSKNQLESLPQTIQNAMIETLILSHNHFQSLPKVVYHMPNLSTVEVADLASSDVPQAFGSRNRPTVHTKRNEEIKDGSLARLSRKLGQLRGREKQSKPNNNLCLIVMGGSDRGRQLLTQKLLSAKTLHNNNGPLELLLWSYRKSVFGTSRINFTTLILPNDSVLCHLYPCFFNPCALFVIAIDLGENYPIMEQINVPMMLLSRYVPKANVQFVLLQPYGSHQDTSELRKLEEVKNAPQYKDFMVFHETFIVSEDPSANANTVTDPRPKFFETAQNVKVNGINVIGASFPENYFGIVEGIGREVQTREAHGSPLALTEQDFWKVVEGSCKGDKPVLAELPDIQEFLKLSGLVIHFPDPNFHLRNFYFICPCWTFDAVSSIISKVTSEGRLVWPLKELQSALGLLSPNIFLPIMRILMRYAVALPIAKDCCFFPFLLSTSLPPAPSAQNTVLRRQFSPINRTLPCDIWHRIIAMVVMCYSDIVEGVIVRHLSRAITVDGTEEAVKAKDTLQVQATSESFEILGESVDYRPPLGGNPIDGKTFRLTNKAKQKMVPLSQRLGRQTSSFYQGKKKPTSTSLNGIPETLSLYDSAVVCDAKPCFFLIRPAPRTSYCGVGIEIATPNTKEGRTLMARLCFLLQNLLQDWYPELYSLDSASSSELSENVLCPACIIDGQTSFTQFGVAASIPSLKRIDNASCNKRENHSTPYTNLLPDIYMQDMPESCHVKMADFTNVHKLPIHTSVDHCMYPAKWKGSDVLLKEYSWNERLSPLLPYFQMRQEVTLLQKLSHVNIIKMQGLMLDFPGRDNTTSPGIVLERAPIGTLRDNLWVEGGSVTRMMRFHIGKQVASALDYLHSCGVIYRALRSSSVLVWSLDYREDVNIKLTNFNRARRVYAYGLHNKPNLQFPCVQAPEVYMFSYSEDYTEKVDIYAYGFLIHEIMSLKPIASQSSVTQPPKLKESFLTMYSSLADLMQQCWKEEPDERPTALQIFSKMKSPVFQMHYSSQSLPEKAKVRHCCIVESAHQIWCSCDVESPQQIWSTTNEATKTQIFIISADSGMSILGSHELKQLANCIASMDSQVLIGLNKGTFRVYESQKYQCTAKCTVTDSVTTVAVNDIYAFVGQANGTLTYYPKLSFPNNSADIQFGNDPIFSMVVIQNVLLVACGTEMIQVNAEDIVSEVKRWSGCTTRENAIYSIATSEMRNCVWTITRTGLTLRTWDLETTECLYELDLQTVLAPICESEGTTRADRVLSILSYGDVVWLSFSNGMVTIMDARMDPMPLITWFRPHVKDTKCQLLIPPLSPDQKGKGRIVTTGYGDHTSTDTRSDKPVVSFWEALKVDELNLLVSRSHDV